MNGRIYDPTIGRFLQADPFIQAPSNSQSFNRYSYVWNNPLSMTDPSGYFSLSFGSIINPLKNITRSLMRKIGPQASQMLVGYVSGFCGPFAPLCAAAGNYEMARAFGASSSGALRTAAIAGVMSYVGSKGNVAVQAIVGGVIEHAQGGNFGHGFWRAGITAYIGQANTGNPYLNVAVDAVVGGSISEVTGGKFKNGAASSAFYSTLRQDWASMYGSGSGANLDEQLKGLTEEQKAANLQKNLKVFKNGLKEIEVLLKSEAVLAVSPNISEENRKRLEKLQFRIKAVLKGQNSKYVLLNAPNEKLEKIISILPGMKSPTVMPLLRKGWSSIHTVINENDFWTVIDQLKANGAEGILTIPIGKMIL